MLVTRIGGAHVEAELVRLAAGTLLVGHRHHTAHALFQLGGVIVDEGTPIATGDLRFSSADDTHLVRADASAVCLLLHFGHGVEPLDRRSIVSDASLTATAADLATSMTAQAAGVDSLLRTLADRTLSIASQNRADIAPPWLRRWHRRIGVESFDDPRALAPRSREHGVRAFRRYYRTTPHAWRRHRRVGEAAVRVVGTSQALADIAASCGFSDQSHMTREFHETLGVTPAALRSARATRFDVTNVQDANAGPAAR